MVKHEGGPQFIKNVGCYGLEYSLLNCSHSRDIQTECDVIEVHCVPGNSDIIIILVPFSVAEVYRNNILKIH